MFRRFSASGARSLCAASLLLGSAVAVAHHSHSMFETGKEVSVLGTVKEFQFTNPHSWLIVVAKSDGQLWSFESQPPSVLARGGVKRSMLMPGDLVTVFASPLKDGRLGGEINMVTKADGTILSRTMFGRGASEGRLGAAGGGGE